MADDLQRWLVETWDTVRESCVKCVGGVKESVSGFLGTYLTDEVVKGLQHTFLAIAGKCTAASVCRDLPLKIIYLIGKKKVGLKKVGLIFSRTKKSRLKKKSVESD